jgi:hypothetical protein
MAQAMIGRRGLLAGAAVSLAGIESKGRALAGLHRHRTGIRLE